MTPEEEMRAELAAKINAAATARAELEAREGQVWDSDEARAAFTFHAFAAPIALVTRRQDGKKGALLFQHRPRYYWGFQPEDA